MTRKKCRVFRIPKWIGRLFTARETDSCSFAPLQSIAHSKYVNSRRCSHRANFDAHTPALSPPQHILLAFLRISQSIDSDHTRNECKLKIKEKSIRSLGHNLCAHKFQSNSLNHIEMTKSFLLDPCVIPKRVRGRPDRAPLH